MKKPVATLLPLLVLFTAFFAATPAANAQLRYVAVVEVEVDARSGASADLSAAEAQEITAELRRTAVRNLPQGRYNIMTSETVQAQGGAVLEECAEENCVITLGSKIGADYIVRGIIRKFKTLLTLSVEIYETEDGNLVASSEAVRSENAAELLMKTAASCAEMFRSFAALQESKPKKTAAENTGAVSASPLDGDITPTADFQKKPELETKPQPPAPKPDAGIARKPLVKKRHTLTAAGLDALGAGIILYGVGRNASVIDKVDARLYADAEKPAGQRNAAYIAGTIILLSGISVHIFF